jgi:hypothetical protein
MQSNNSVGQANIRMLEFVAIKLGAVCNDVVFLGGCTTGLFVTDPQFPDVRYTLDVDCIIDVISLKEYHQLEKRLTRQGFKKSLSEEVICRWFYDDVILDVMPTDEKICKCSVGRIPSVVRIIRDCHSRCVNSHNPIS